MKIPLAVFSTISSDFMKKELLFHVFHVLCLLKGTRLGEGLVGMVHHLPLTLTCGLAERYVSILFLIVQSFFWGTCDGTLRTGERFTFLVPSLIFLGSKVGQLTY